MTASAVVDNLVTPARSEPVPPFDGSASNLRVVTAEAPDKDPDPGFLFQACRLANANPNISAALARLASAELVVGNSDKALAAARVPSRWRRLPTRRWGNLVTISQGHRRTFLPYCWQSMSL